MRGWTSGEESSIAARRGDVKLSGPERHVMQGFRYSASGEDMPIPAIYILPRMTVVIVLRTADGSVSIRDNLIV